MNVVNKAVLMGLVVLSLSVVAADDAAAGRRNFNHGASYMGLDYQALNVAPAAGADFEPSAVRFRSGHMYDENFGYEMHLAVGTDSDVQGSTDLEMDYYYGFALRGQLPLTANVAVYGLAGLGWTNYSVTRRSLTSTQTSLFAGSDFAYGGGVVIRLGSQAMLSAEWMSQLSNEDFDFTSLNIGISRLF